MFIWMKHLMVMIMVIATITNMLVISVFAMTPNSSMY